MVDKPHILTLFLLGWKYTVVKYVSVGGPIEGPRVRNRVNVVRDVLSKYYIIEDINIGG